MKNKTIVDAYWNMCQYTLPNQQKVCSYELFGKVINDFIEKLSNKDKEITQKGILVELISERDHQINELDKEIEILNHELKIAHIKLQADEKN